MAYHNIKSSTLLPHLRKTFKICISTKFCPPFAFKADWMKLWGDFNNIACVWFFFEKKTFSCFRLKWRSPLITQYPACRRWLLTTKFSSSNQRKKEKLNQTKSKRKKERKISLNCNNDARYTKMKRARARSEASTSPKIPHYTINGGEWDSNNYLIKVKESFSLFPFTLLPSSLALARNSACLGPFTKTGFATNTATQKSFRSLGAFALSARNLGEID